MVVYDSERRQVKFSHQISRGGESAIYRVEGQPDRLVKIYTTPHIAVYQQKLTWMLAHPPDDPTAHLGHTSLAWPQGVLRDEQGLFVGYLMPYVQNAVTVLRVFNPRLRAQTLPDFDRRYLHRTARNLAAAVEALHTRDYVIGDLHESNIMVTSSALVTLIDTDSFQVEAEEAFYPCIVGKPEYTPPELQGKSFQEVRRTPEHDCFGLGVLIFQLLMEGNHPFRGRWLGSDDPPPFEEKIRRGLFPYAQTPSGLVAPPPTGWTLEILYPEVVSLIQQCFVDGHHQPDLRPKPSEWKQALARAEDNLTSCPQGHYYSNYLDTCPRCRTQAAKRRRPERPRQIEPQPRPAPRPIAQPVPRPVVSSARPRPSSATSPGTSRTSSTSFTQWSPAASQWGVLVILAVAVVACLVCLMSEASVERSSSATRTPIPTPLPPRLLPRPTDIPPPQLITDTRGVPMVLVPAGPFEMGSESGRTNEQPVHTVTLDAFYVDQYEVTNARFAAFLNTQADDSEVVTTLLRYVGTERFHILRHDGEWQAQEGYADHPVVYVSWWNAQAYCEWRGGRLPTEAEWEKAARGTDGREFPWGEGIDCTMANYDGCLGSTTAVGFYPEGVSPYGAYDMTGNVQEWVNDRYQADYYSDSPSVNPPGPDGSGVGNRILRGGGFRELPDWTFARVTSRSSWDGPASHFINTGIRCVASDPTLAGIPTPLSISPTASISLTAVPTTPVSEYRKSAYLPVYATSVVFVPGGLFRMGSERHRVGGHEQPDHRVELDAFSIDRYEVTNAQYAACVEAGVCQLPGDCRYWGRTTYYDTDKADHPVTCVDWYDAQTYCEWRGRRLPTEAEWEKAARGTDGRRYPWSNASNTLDCDHAQYDRCGSGTVPVASKPSGVSPYGVHGMTGNVGEWVADWYDRNYYIYSPTNNPQGPDSGIYKMWRGGDWFLDSSFLTTGERFFNYPDNRNNRVGFRCAADQPGEE